MGEGTKNGGVVALSNSDPDIIKVFLCFLRRVCGITEDRLRILLHIYKDQNENQLKKFWSSVTTIPLRQFVKTYMHKGKKGTYKNKSHYGTISLRYSDKRLLEYILSCIKKFTKQWLTPG